MGRGLWVQLPAAALIVLLIGAGAELLLRAGEGLTPVRYSVWEPRSRFSVEVDPEVTPGVTGAVDFRINALGLRGRLPGRSDRLRILALGGSTTECLLLEEGEAWPALLEALLDADNGGGVWVGNAGISGRSTREFLFDAELLVPQFDVDTVILLPGANDLTSHLQQLERFSPRRPADTLADEDLLAASLIVNERAGGPRVVRELKKMFRRPGTRGAEGAEWILQDPRTTDFYRRYRASRARRAVMIDSPAKLESALEEYEENLRHIVAKLTKAGVTPVLATQPSLWRGNLEASEESLLWLGMTVWPPQTEGGTYFSPPALATMLGWYNDRVRAVAREKKATLVDLDRLLPKSTETFYDDVHFNERGARRTAEEIARVLTGGTSGED